jgi:putative ABC transport system permease protein
MNYLTIAWRKLISEKGYSLLYVVGLALGLGVVLLDGLWIHDELSFNQYHKHYDRIAQVMHHDTFNGERLTMPWSPSVMGDLLRNEYGPEFKQVIMSTYPGPHTLTLDKKNLSFQGAYMDQGAPSMLSLEMLEGTQDGLNDPSSILLSKSTATAIFGTTDPMGKTLRIDNLANVRVTGVYKDIPANSDFKDQAFIAPWNLFTNATGAGKDPNPWLNNSYLTYVQLPDHADLAKTSAKIKDFKKNHLPPSEKMLKSEVFLYPMSRWHLYSEFKDGVNTGGQIQFVWLFAFIGAFVLLQACINFINLTTARAQTRAKEIGIRKTIGSLRSQLMTQFFFESVLIALLAFTLAVLLVQLFLPLFNHLADKNLSILWTNPWFWAAGITFSIIVGIVAGIYPATYLSSFNPVKVLKGSFKAGRLAIVKRKALVVLQFTISIVLVIGTIVVFRQIQYGKDREIGYNPANVITTALTSDMYMHFDAFREEAKKSGAAIECAKSTNSTIIQNAVEGGFEWEGNNPNAPLAIPISNVSVGYGQTIGWKLKAGRDFSKEFATDSAAFILNEAAVKFMNLKHPIGTTIRWNNKPFTIIGVIRDIVFESPYQAVQPYVYEMGNDLGYAFVTIKLNTNRGVQASIDKLKVIYDKCNPNFPFTYQFTDLDYGKKFINEVRIGQLASFFAILALFISCLGIFGLSAFVTQQRMKEIVIRKVLGAPSFGLFAMLSKGFNRLVALSFLIGAPIAWFAARHWLQNYEYRSAISWWIFAAAGLGLLMTTWLSTSYHAIKAASTNPVKSLRTE